jgi:hypothetical protein
MGQSGRELTNGDHPIHVSDFVEFPAPRRFGVLLIGDVHGRADVAGKNIAAGEARNPLAQQPSVLAVGPAQPALYLEVLTGIK